MVRAWPHGLWSAVLTHAACLHFPHSVCLLDPAHGGFVHVHCLYDWAQARVCVLNACPVKAGMVSGATAVTSCSDSC